MSATQEVGTEGADRQWFIVGRWQEYEGEARANLLRIVGIVVFYLVELVNYHGLRLGFLEIPKVEDVNERFHQAVTALAVAWTMVGLGILLSLRRQIFPSQLKFISTGCDLVFLTAILTVADGPRSPLLVGYFLIIALSSLRFSVPLIWFATAGSMAGYLFLSGYAKWFREALRVPRYHQVMFLLGLLLTGIALGQVVRRVRWIAQEYAGRLGTASLRVDQVESP